MSPQAITRFSLVFLALIALTGSARAYDDADDSQSAPVAGIRYILRTLDQAAYNPALLDGQFFKVLATFAPDSEPLVAFRAALGDIRWYRNPTARQWVHANNPRFYRHFIRDNRVRVFIDVITDDPALAASVRGSASTYLPEYARATGYRSDADVIIRLRARISEPTFYVVSEKQRRKKYKKAYRKNAIAENRLFYGYYTQVKERGKLRVDYRVRVIAGYATVGSFRNSLTLTDSFKYITDFRAQGGTGWVTDAPYPSKKIARRATRNVEDARLRTAESLRISAAHTLAHAVAEVEVPLRSELYPRARRYSHRDR